MDCARCGSAIPSGGRFCPSCGALVPIPATPIVAGPVVDLERDEDDAGGGEPGEGDSRARTGPDVPQVSFVMWGWGCLGILTGLAHGFAVALLTLFLVLGAIGASQGTSIANDEVLTAGGIALAVVVVTRLVGRVRVHMGVDASLDELWVKVGEQVRSIHGAGGLTGFELDKRVRTKKVRHKGGRIGHATSTAYRLMAVFRGGGQRRVPHLPEMSWWSAKSSLRAGNELVSLLGRPRA